MSEELDVLVELARQDDARVEVRRALGEVPGRLATLDRRMEELRRRASEAKAALEAARVERREKEGQIKDLEAEANRLNMQLFQLKSNEAYTAMLKEIAAAKDRRSELETEVLVLMDGEEQQVKELQRRETALAEDTRTVDAERQRLEQAEAGLRERLAAVESARSGLLPRLSSGLRSKYERVLASKDGQAVGLVTHNACGGCHATLPPQLLSEVRQRDALKVCETCGRLLAWAGA